MLPLNASYDPCKVIKLLWPRYLLSREQQEIAYSVWYNDETFVPAGNMLGKDFIAGLLALVFFITRSPCRIITTSVDHTQLEGVLWGEIRRHINECAYPLNAEDGGPLVINHLHIRKMIPVLDPNGKPTDTRQLCGLSYLIGRVAAKGEGFLGHHIAKTGDGIPRTLFIGDEASGLDDICYDRADTWSDRKLIIGNPYTCSNFFKRGVKGGDILAPQ